MTEPTLRFLSEEEEESYLPAVLPAGWTRIPADGPAFQNVGGLGPLRGVRVLVSVSIEEDGRRWMHVSVSRPTRCPSWEDMDATKRIFIGDHRVAYQVHPPRAEHYDLNRTVLHLWAPVEGDPPLPNFLRARGGTL